MKLPLNLASDPQENLRPYHFGIVVGCLLAAVLLGTLIQKERRYRTEFRTIIGQTQQKGAEIDRLEQEDLELENWLSTSEVKQIRDRSAFLNSLILQKSLSWTRMFQDLEEILPVQARVTAIRPSFNQSLQAELNLSIGAESVDPLVELLKRLETSEQFGTPLVSGQQFPSDISRDREILLDLATGYWQAAELTDADQDINAEEETPLALESPEYEVLESEPPVSETGTEL
jgi:Tfp pilus assembly protein PilN